ncbi:RHS repeat-associated core domain-containing protein [Pseudomonas sp. Sample_10]|uniref:RHS repeat-associated core domain-containing protein n=1 Tax=Pseudomonas sp. Sample_10 TaxID=2448269 RepID=UPI001035D6F0|nr:RHS repeat-associated core domain-containing protein [Pseudomonas sp. Sample_10]
MQVSSLKILCRYVYDPLDRLIGMGLVETVSTQRFYQANHLITELGQQTQRTIFRYEIQPLAQQHNAAGVSETKLLATDQAHSLLRTAEQQVAYTAYGHHPTESGLSRLIGFNGECPDPVTGHYPLGQGTRVFNPVLMRFNSPDVLSPFGKGGINAYMYCEGNPINYFDPTGNIKELIKAFAKTSITQTRTNNALKTIRPTSSTISRNRQAISSAPRPMPTAEILTPELAQLTLPLPKTKMPANGITVSLEEGSLLQAGRRFDELKSTHNIKTVATREQVELLLSHKKQVQSATTATAKQLITEKSNGVILHIKKTSVDYHEAQVANIRQSGSSSTSSV